MEKNYDNVLIGADLLDTAACHARDIYVQTLAEEEQARYLTEVRRCIQAALLFLDRFEGK